MADTELATVGLNLDGSFEAQAEAQAEAADKLDEALEKLNTTAQKTKAPKIDLGAQAVTKELEQQAQLEAKIATFDAQRVRNVAALEARYKAMKDAALGKGPAPAPAGKPELEFKGLGGTSILGGAVALGGASALALKAGEMILSAAKELAVGAAELVKGAEELAIAETSKREVQSAIFGKLGGDYDVAVKLAAKMGIDEDKAVGDIKKLLGAKFSATELPVLMRVALGIGAVAGEDKAHAYLEKLTKESLKGGKATEETIKGFAEAGVDLDRVYAKLAAKMGTSVAIVKAKLKSNQVDMKQALAAVNEAATEQFGDIADKMADSIPALLVRLKSDFRHMFDDIDLEPLKDVLKNVAEVLEGPEGEELKGSLKELLDNLNHTLFDQFRGEEGKEKLREFVREFASGMRDLASAVKDAKPVVELLTDLGKDAIIGGILLLTYALRGTTEVVNALSDPLGTLIGWLRELGIIEDETGTKAEAAGENLAAGFAEGIENGASNAISAAIKMARDAIDGATSELDVNSPSREFAWLGDMSAEGFAGAMNDNAGPAQAGANMAQSALGGAAGAAAGGAGGGAAGAGGAPVQIIFAPQITLGGGGSDSAKMKAILAELYPDFVALVRRAQREGLLPAGGIAA